MRSERAGLAGGNGGRDGCGGGAERAGPVEVENLSLSLPRVLPLALHFCACRELLHHLERKNDHWRHPLASREKKNHGEGCIGHRGLVIVR